MAAARRELTAANASVVVLDNEPLTSLMRQSISQDLLVAQVASFFGALALALAALGLYGVMMYATLRRTSEFGLRMALGADARRVRGMVLSEAMRLVIGGTIVGVPLAIAATRLLRNQLFGVELVDPPSIGVALGVLAVSAAKSRAHWSRGWPRASRLARYASSVRDRGAATELPNGFRPGAPSGITMSQLIPRRERSDVTNDRRTVHAGPSVSQTRLTERADEHDMPRGV